MGMKVGDIDWQRRFFFLLFADRMQVLHSSNRGSEIRLVVSIFNFLMCNQSSETGLWERMAELYGWLIDLIFTGTLS